MIDTDIDISSSCGLIFCKEKCIIHVICFEDNGQMGWIMEWLQSVRLSECSLPSDMLLNIRGVYIVLYAE